MDPFWIQRDDLAAERLIAEGEMRGLLQQGADSSADCPVADGEDSNDSDDEIETGISASPANRRCGFAPRTDFDEAEGSLIELLFPEHFQSLGAIAAPTPRPEMNLDLSRFVTHLDGTGHVDRTRMELRELKARRRLKGSGSSKLDRAVKSKQREVARIERHVREIAKERAKKYEDERLEEWRLTTREFEKAAEQWYEKTALIAADLAANGVTLKVRILAAGYETFSWEKPWEYGIASCGWCGCKSPVAAEVHFRGEQYGASYLEACLGCLMGDEFERYSTESLREADVCGDLWLQELVQESSLHSRLDISLLELQNAWQESLGDNG